MTSQSGYAGVEYPARRLYDLEGVEVVDKGEGIVTTVGLWPKAKHPAETGWVFWLQSTYLERFFGECLLRVANSLAADAGGGTALSKMID